MKTLVWVEHDGTSVKDATLAVVTAAAKLGDVHLLVAGKGVDGVAAEAAKIAGVGKVHVADDAAYAHALAENVAPLVVSLMDSHDAFLAPATSNGKNIAPSNIENYLKESPIVGHAMAVGDNEAYVVAVLTLDGEIAPLVAEKIGLGFTDLADLAAKPEIRAMAQEAVDKANARLSRPEQIKAFELLPVEWTAESEELTPTLKLKRRVVNHKYADVLDRLYG